MVSRVRLERHAKGHSFLELAANGKDLGRTWGGLHRPASGHRTEPFADHAGALLALQRQACRAAAKGFWVGHHNLELIAAIAENVEADSGYLAYGSWLLERGDVRGAMIQASPPERDRLIRTQRLQLSPEHWQSWLHPEWEMGFVHSLLATMDDSHSTLRDTAARFRRALLHPSNHFVRRITIQQRISGNQLVQQQLQDLWRPIFEGLPLRIKVVVQGEALGSIALATLGKDRVQLVQDPTARWSTRRYANHTHPWVKPR